MKRRTKVACIVAAAITGVGLCLCFLGLLAGGHSFSSLFSQTFSPKTILVDQDFSNIRLETDIADVHFYLTDDDVCTIACQEDPFLPFTAAVENGTLTIEEHDNRKWFHHIGVHWRSPSMDVYLPKAAYGTLVLDGSTGDLQVPEGFSFESVQIEATTGDTTFRAQVAQTLSVHCNTGSITLSEISAKSLDLKASTGDIRIQSAQVQDILQISTDTGDIHLSDVSCKSVQVKSSTGDQTYTQFTATGDARMESDTGDIDLLRFDAAAISIKTDTGDVCGTLLSEKIFFTETDTGDVDVPNSLQGGSCEITTDTGDVEISYVQ